MSKGEALDVRVEVGRGSLTLLTSEAAPGPVLGSVTVIDEAGNELPLAMANHPRAGYWGLIEIYPNKPGFLHLKGTEVADFCPVQITALFRRFNPDAQVSLGGSRG